MHLPCGTGATSLAICATGKGVVMRGAPVAKHKVLVGCGIAAARPRCPIDGEEVALSHHGEHAKCEQAVVNRTGSATEKALHHAPSHKDVRA